MSSYTISTSYLTRIDSINGICLTAQFRSMVLQFLGSVKLFGMDNATFLKFFAAYGEHNKGRMEEFSS